jgi:hypothetical protein
MSDLLAALAAADEQYAGVDAAEGFDLHPEFKGIATVETARLEQKESRVQLFVKLKTEVGSTAIWITLMGFSDKNTEKQVAFSKKTLLHLGHTGPFAELARDGGTGHLIGRQVEIQVKHETYEGTKRERVYTNRAVEGGAASSAETTSFAAQFNAPQQDLSDIPEIPPAVV